MATSVQSSSPVPLNKGSPSLMCSSSSSPPVFSPCSDQQFWSTLRGRTESLLEKRKPVDHPTLINAEATNRAKRLKEDSMLLLRGFDSVAHSLSQLSNNLENALQGARDLAKPPTVSEIVHATLERARYEENKKLKDEHEEKHSKEGSVEDTGVKRKLESQECSEDEEENSKEEKEQGTKELEGIKKAKNLAMSMATKAATVVRELKSVKSDLTFMQERCALLEEENRKLRDGFAKGIPPEEDDLVRLQLEALLAEKSRLANENANLKRENQCLHQLVEYHQITTQDLSASYENLVSGMCLDFSSPLGYEAEDEVPTTRGADIFGFSRTLDDCYDEEPQDQVKDSGKS